jgi:hypothetical protein
MARFSETSPDLSYYESTPESLINQCRLANFYRTGIQALNAKIPYSFLPCAIIDADGGNFIRLDRVLSDISLLGSRTGRER